MKVLTQTQEREQEVDRQDGEVSGSAFTRLLQWLDAGTESHGERYLEMRRLLVTYFERRNRPAADMLADETFDRIARTLDTGQIRITPPARYCYVVARFVLLEDIRKSRRTVVFDENRAPVRHHAAAAHTDDEPAARSLDSLEPCLAVLTPAERALIIEYYEDTKRRRIDRRRELARRLGISMNALAIRAWRLRATLESCMAACAAKG
jgi:DNA-directed RNA polymerase specialized sigma24 family protein